MSRYGDGRGPPVIEGMTSLKVDNLTYRTTIDDLDRYFKKYGDIGDIYIPKDRNTHNSRGFAFVRFHEKKDAEAAMDALDGKVIDGREIRVANARYGRPENQYNPRGGGRSSYSSRDRDRDRRRSPRRRSRSRSRSPQRRRSRSPRSRSPVQRSRSPRSPARRSMSPGARNLSPSRSRSPRSPR